MGRSIGTKNEDGEEVFIGDLSPVDKKLERDSFIRKVADNIITTPSGVNFQPLEVKDGYVYIIEVAQAEPSHINTKISTTCAWMARPEMPHTII